MTFFVWSRQLPPGLLFYVAVTHAKLAYIDKEQSDDTRNSDKDDSFHNKGGKATGWGLKYPISWCQGFKKY